MSNFLLIYVTYPSEKEAQRICATLLEKKLIACANIYPIQSMYRWKGEIKNEKEWVSIVKSSIQNLEDIQEEIHALHPYDVPCITHWEANANENYKKWIGEESMP